MLEQRPKSKAPKKVMMLIACAVLVAAAVAATVAPAHNVNFANQVTLTYAKDYGNLGLYKGRVNSARANCERNREVQIFRVDNPSDVRIARGRTYASGAYKIKGTQIAAGQKAYALIETKVIPTGAGHNHTCAVDRSPVRTYPYP